jgi:hypothetical protein
MRTLLSSIISLVIGCSSCHLTATEDKALANAVTAADPMCADLNIIPLPVVGQVAFAICGIADPAIAAALNSAAASAVTPAPVGSSASTVKQARAIRDDSTPQPVKCNLPLFRGTKAIPGVKACDPDSQKRGQAAIDSIPASK